MLPVFVLLVRAFRPRRMPWWAALAIVAGAGWLFVNGAVLFHFEHLGDLIEAHGDNPPEELVERWASDGGKRVFALFFGWIYALLYSIPFVAVYGTVQLVRRLLAGRPGKPAGRCGRRARSRWRTRRGATPDRTGV